MSEDISIKQQVRVFGETVSVRGLAKVLKSQGLILKIFWFCAVVISLGLLLWQLSSVFIKYCSYQITSTYDEGTASNVLPDVTICNINSVADSISSQLSWKDYLKLVEKQRHAYPIDLVNELYPNWKVDNKTYDQIWSDLQTPAGYISNFPMLPKSESSNHKLIPDCYYMNWDWSQNTVVYCSYHINMIWDSNYYDCYTVRLPEKYQKDIKGVSIISYVSNFPNTIVNDFEMDMGHSSGTGIRVVFHEPGTKPLIKTGISVSPGMEATVVITATNRTRLTRPYGENECTTQKYLPFSNEEVYSYDACFEVCLQNDVAKYCNCVDSQLSFTETQLSKVKSKTCQNQSFIENNGDTSISSNGIDKMMCSYAMNTDMSECHNKCPLPCNEIYYGLTIDTATWPHISQHLAFYKKFIKGKGEYIWPSLQYGVRAHFE